jgi:hypothetical protein
LSRGFPFSQRAHTTAIQRRHSFSNVSKKKASSEVIKSLEEQKETERDTSKKKKKKRQKKVGPKKLFGAAVEKRILYVSKVLYIHG